MGEKDDVIIHTEEESELTPPAKVFLFLLVNVHAQERIYGKERWDQDDHTQTGRREVLCSDRKDSV